MSIEELLVGIQAQTAARLIRITDHAREEMEDEVITLAEVLEAIVFQLRFVVYVAMCFSHPKQLSVWKLCDKQQWHQYVLFLSMSSLKQRNSLQVLS